jgi:hypothetical protein
MNKLQAHHRAHHIFQIVFWLIWSLREFGSSFASHTHGNGLLTLITLRGQLASRIKNTEGRQPKRINAIPNRSPDLGIPSRTNALWPSFRPFCHPIQHTGARYTLEQKHGRLFLDAYGKLDLIPIGNRTRDQCNISGSNKRSARWRPYRFPCVLRVGCFFPTHSGVLG